MKKSQPVLWAMDPYSDLQTNSEKVLKFVQKLKAETAPLEISYVLSPESVRWDGPLAQAWVKQMKPSIEKTLSGLKLEGVARQNILVNPRPSLSRDIKTFCSHAEQKKAEFVVLHTHARKGIKRLFLGSFTEGVLVQTKVPVLVINPQAQLPSAVSRVLAPTDLSKKSCAALTKLIPIFQRLSVEVHFFYKMMDPIEPIVQGSVLVAGGGLVGFDQFYEKDLKSKKARLEKLVASFQAVGVKSSSVFEEKYGVVSDLILSAAHREKCQMIVTGTSTGPAEAALMGSVARSLARESDLPLLIYPAR